MGTVVLTSEPSPSTSASEVLKELETYTKSKVITPKVLSRPVKKIITSKQRPSKNEKSNEGPTLPSPENGAIYKPIEAYNILRSMDTNKPSKTIQKMVDEKLILCSRSQMNKILNKDEAEIKSWWNVKGRQAPLRSHRLHSYFSPPRFKDVAGLQVDWSNVIEFRNKFSLEL